MVHHLLKAENEKIVMHNMLGMGEDKQALMDAMVEMQLYTKMVEGNRGIFSVAISPREEDVLTPKQMDRAIEIIEKEFELEDQNKIRVDHEKDGRFHAHLFWSLVHHEDHKLIKIDFYKRRLQERANQMTKEFGLEEVRRRPNEQTIEVNNHDRMAAQREGKTAPKYKERKEQVTQIWEATKDKDVEVFIHELRQAGYDLAQGSKASVVLIDQDGDQFNLARDLPRLVKAKHVRERFEGLEKPLLTVQKVLDSREYDSVQERIDQQNTLHDSAHTSGQKTAKRQIQMEQQQKSRTEDLENRKRQVQKRSQSTGSLQHRELPKEKPANDGHLVKLDQERRWERDTATIRKQHEADMQPLRDKVKQDRARIAELKGKLVKRAKEGQVNRWRHARQIRADKEELKNLRLNLAANEPNLKAQEEMFQNRLEQSKPVEMQKDPPVPDKSSVIDFKLSAEKAEKERLREEFLARRRREQEEQNRGEEYDQGIGYD